MTGEEMCESDSRARGEVDTIATSSLDMFEISKSLLGNLS
jgi:hypothetical protein